MRRIGKQLVEERKRELGFLPPKSGEQQSQERDAPSSGTGKDLLSLMIKANMSPDVSPEQRMTDAEVMHQIPTFMVAGHETTATGLVWALYSLSTHPEVQSRLRTELYTLSSPTPTMNELNELSYFDAVVKECLRLNSPFENTLRIAQADDVIPVGKPFLDRSGQLRDRVRIKKGDGVFLPVLVMNRLEEIWGPDAAEFDPERWFKLPEATNSVPSVWGNQFSFLSGPRSCIGFRFAVMEMKSILYTLIRNFEFKLGVAEEDILKTSAIVTRPMEPKIDVPVARAIHTHNLDPYRDYGRVCGFPPEYCEFGSHLTKCKAWLEEEHPALFQRYYSEDALTAKAATLSLEAQNKLEEDTVKKERKAEARAEAEAKKKMSSRITIKRIERNKKKYVTA
ncbi:hypothetical protein FRC18_007563, partial [Serendipita sp. 400]